MVSLFATVWALVAYPFRVARETPRTSPTFRTSHAGGPDPAVDLGSN